MRFRLLAAAFAGLLLASLPAAAQVAKAHIAAAKKAEKAKNYKKMLAEYQAACVAEPSSECQLGVADAFARLGQKDKARSAYEALINDPFGQENFVARAKSALARLGSGGEAVAELPPMDLPAPEMAAASPGLPPLDLGAPAAPAEKKPAKKAAKKTEVAAAPSTDLPPLDLPPALPEMAAPAAKKPKKETKVAAAAPAELPPLDLGAPPPAAAPAKKNPLPKAVAKHETKPEAKPGELPPLDLSLPPMTADAKPPKAPAAMPDLPPLDLPPVKAPAETPPKVAASKPPKLEPKHDPKHDLATKGKDPKHKDPKAVAIVT